MTPIPQNNPPPLPLKSLCIYVYMYVCMSGHFFPNFDDTAQQKRLDGFDFGFSGYKTYILEAVHRLNFIEIDSVVFMKLKSEFSSIRILFSSCEESTFTFSFCLKYVWKFFLNTIIIIRKMYFNCTYHIISSRYVLLNSYGFIVIYS